MLLSNKCWPSCHRRMRTQSTMRHPLWPSSTASLHWQSHNLSSLSTTPTDPRQLTTHATSSLSLRHQSTQPSATVLLATLMLCCTKKFISAFYLQLTHQIWPVGSPYTSQSSSQCSYWQASSWKLVFGDVAQTTKFGMNGVSFSRSILPYTTPAADHTL